jgi:hypothetical protein
MNYQQLASQIGLRTAVRLEVWMARGEHSSPRYDVPGMTFDVGTVVREAESEMALTPLTPEALRPALPPVIAAAAPSSLFTAEEIARLRIYRAAVTKGFYTDECDWTPQS